MKRLQVSSAIKAKTIKKETREVFGPGVQDCKPDWFLRTSSTTWYTDSRLKQSPSSEVDTNTTLITSKSKYDDVGIIVVSQAGSSSSCLTTDLTLPANSLATSTTNVDASCFIIHSGVEIIAGNESLVGQGDGSEMIQSAKDEVNVAKDPRLWLDSLLMTWLIALLVDPVTNGPFDKSYRYFGSGKPVRCCSQKLFVGTKANGEKYKREWLLSPSTGSVHCFVCKPFAPKNFSHFVQRLEKYFCNWSYHKKSTIHRNSMPTYLIQIVEATVGKMNSGWVCTDYLHLSIYTLLPFYVYTKSFRQTFLPISLSIYIYNHRR